MEKKPGWRNRARSLWRDHLRVLLAVVLVMLSFRSAIADWNDVPTGSMKPTILEGDRIVVNKLAYDLRVPFTDLAVARWSSPRRGDVVVLYSPDDGTRLVKRVVGLPDDVIELDHNRILVNGQQAHYEPLDPAVAEQLEPADRAGSLFAWESLAADDRHPVMARPWVSAERSFGPLTVPYDHFFVMGDNRDLSLDSRFFGCVERSLVVGRVTGVALSLDPERSYKPRWDRFLSGLD